MERFDPDAVDRVGAERYLRERAVQALIDGFYPEQDTLEPLFDGALEWGLRARSCAPDGTVFQTIYVYAAQRGKGYLSNYLQTHPEPVVTVPDCHLEAWLTKKQHPFRVIARSTDTDEYRSIAAHYGVRCAQRSRVPYMHHIDEGLAVLTRIRASERAMRAYCLHPLVQADRDLAQTYAKDTALTKDPHVLMLAMEYRNIANATLSHRVIAGSEDIFLSPLPEVQAMLVADKVQNYKDFLLHHAGKHPRSQALDRYFRLWLERLGVSLEAFAEHFEALQPRPSRERQSLR